MSGLILFNTKETPFKLYTYMYMFIMFITCLCPGITGQILKPKFYHPKSQHKTNPTLILNLKVLAYKNKLLSTSIVLSSPVCGRRKWGAGRKL